MPVTAPGTIAADGAGRYKDRCQPVMISYLAVGSRQYGSGGDIRRRPDWEFLAVTRGRIAPALAGEAPVMRASTLWVFPPGLAHDWVGEGDIAVAHATAVPGLLRAVAEDLAARGSPIIVALGTRARRRVRLLALELRRDVRAPDGLSPLRQEMGILELSIIALSGVPRDLLPAPRPGPQRVVDRAMAWIREHLAAGADIAGAARAVGVSPAHLRRLFHAVHGSSPRSAMREARLGLAEELLHDRGLTLERIARRCGFADAPSLSRAFRAVRGRAPRRAGRG